MNNLATMQQNFWQKPHRPSIDRPKVSDVYHGHFWRRFALKAKDVMTGFYYSMIVAATVAAILLFVATAIVVGIYVVLYLAAFVVAILGKL